MTLSTRGPDQRLVAQDLDAAVNERPGRCGAGRLPGEVLGGQSTNGVDRVVKATTHASLLDDEADSAAASTAIHDVVASVRTSQPLASR